VTLNAQDVEVALDDERRKGEDVKQSALMLERKRIQLQTELDNIRALLETVYTLIGDNNSNFSKIRSF